MEGFSTDAAQLIHCLFEQQAQSTPQAIAVCDNDQELSYQELNQQANQVAHLLIKQGISSNDVVGLYMERTVDLVVGILGILKAGGAYLPIDLSFPQSRQAYVLDDAKASILLSHASLKNSLPNDMHCIMLEDAHSQAKTNPVLKKAPIPDDLVYVLYTSGSTGQPKGVEICHHGLSNVIRYRIANLLSESERAVIPLTASVGFDASAGQIFTPICSGGKLVMTPNLLEITTSKYFDEITCIGSTPSVIRTFINNNALPPSLKVLFLGGEHVEQDLCELVWQKTNITKLINLYGPTEATVHATYAILFERDRLERYDEPAINLPITIGKPIDNTGILILDDTLQPCAPNQPGEIYITGIGLARGYRFRKELTLEKFKTIFINNEKIMAYATGDLGTLLDNGDIHFIGRTDRQVKVRGYRIELDEIESILMNHKAVKQGAIELADTAQGKSIVAYLSLDKEVINPQAQLSEIKRDISQSLPHYMMPHHFLLMEQLPLTSNDKLDRKSLPPIGKGIEVTDNAIIKPENDLQNIIAKAWQLALNKEEVSIHDSFTSLGGDSLLAVQVVTALKAYKVDVNIGDLFEYPTIKTLSDMLEADAQGFKRPPAIQLSSDNLDRTLFCCSGINLYQPLANYLRSSCSTYGLYTAQEDIFLNAEQLADDALPSIEAIAKAYVDTIMKHQKEGPYYLLGISFGGVIAFEVASMLKEQGAIVGHVFLLDPVLTASVKKKRIEWTLLKCYEALTSPFKMLEKVKNSLLQSDQSMPLQKASPALDVSKLDAIRRQRFRHIVMAYEQTMQPYSGDVTLFFAQKRKKRPGYRIDTDLGWSSYINGVFDVQQFDGDHLDILTQPLVAQLAQTIQHQMSKV